LDLAEEEEKTTVYIWLYYGEYSSDKDGNAVCINLKKGPVAITAQKANDSYELIEYREAENMENAKEIFPSYLQGKLTYLYKDAPPLFEREIWNNFFNTAKAYFNTSKADYIMDSIKFDIDGDGEKEYFALTPGPTSGIISINFSAYVEKTKEIFNNFFVIDFETVEFLVQDDKLFIKCTELNGEVRILEVMRNETEIFLLENGERIGLREFGVGYPVNFHGVNFFS